MFLLCKLCSLWFVHSVLMCPLVVLCVFWLHPYMVWAWWCSPTSVNDSWLSESPRHRELSVYGSSYYPSDWTSYIHLAWRTISRISDTKEALSLCPCPGHGRTGRARGFLQQQLYLIGRWERTATGGRRSGGSQVTVQYPGDPTLPATRMGPLRRGEGAMGVATRRITGE